MTPGTICTDPRAILTKPHHRPPFSFPPIFEKVGGHVRWSGQNCPAPLPSNPAWEFPYLLTLRGSFHIILPSGAVSVYSNLEKKNRKFFFKLFLLKESCFFFAPNHLKHRKNRFQGRVHFLGGGAGWRGWPVRKADNSPPIKLTPGIFTPVF